MKKFLFGFFVAALLFSTIPIGAAVQEYILKPANTKILYNGAEVKDKLLPVLTYQENKYIPESVLKEICQRSNLGYASTGSSIQITPYIKASSIPSTKLTPDGIKATYDTKSGNYFVFISAFHGKYSTTPKYSVELVLDEKSKSTYCIKKDGNLFIDTVQLADGKRAFEFNYYVNTILPQLN